MRKSTFVALLVVGALLIPAAVFAAHSFDDVPDGHTHHNGIAWMKDNNITAGCNPPTNDNFCPNDNVTRGQMATFMKRLAENNVVDAATLDGQDSTAFLRATTIETSEASSGWTSNSGVMPTTEEHFITRAFFSGDGTAEIALTSPISFGATGYGLTNVRLCLQAPGAGFLNDLNVYRLTSSVVSELAFQDLTDRTATGCFDYPMDVAIGEGLSIAAGLSGGGTVHLGTVHLTWEAGAGLNSVALSDRGSDPALGD